MMLAVGGMMLFVAAGDLLTLFVGLEVLSLPLYILTGLARRRRLLSQGSGPSYFLLGAFSSAFLLFGAALLYGVCRVGLPQRDCLGDQRRPARPRGAPRSRGAARPRWTALQGRRGALPPRGPPTCTRGSDAGHRVHGRLHQAGRLRAMLRVVYVGAAGDRWNWSVVVVVIAAPTMIVGAVMSVTQTDVKRLLAYSSIAHAGFIPHRGARLRCHGRLRGDVLSRHLRPDDHRRLRDCLPRPGRPERLRGDASVPVGRAGSKAPRGGRDLRLPHAGLRRHTADLGLRRQAGAFGAAVGHGAPPVPSSP